MRSNKHLGIPALLLMSGSVYMNPALAIDTPRELRGTEIRQDTVKWEWEPVAGAVSYEVTVNDRSLGQVDETKFYNSGLSADGATYMYVQAVDEDGDLSEKTPTEIIYVSENYIRGSYGKSKEVGSSGSSNRSFSGSGGSSSTTSLRTVKGLEFDEYSDGDVRWQWDEVSGAEEYEVKVDGIVVGRTTNTHWVSKDLWTGTHSLTVKAVDSSGNKTEQSVTLKVRVTGQGSGDAGDNDEDSNDSGNFSPPPVNDDDDDDDDDDSRDDDDDDDSRDDDDDDDSRDDDDDENYATTKSLIDSATYSEDYRKDGYKLVFSDEFGGRELNPNRWHTQLRWDGDWNGERYEYRVVNGEDQFYVNTLGPDQEHIDKVASIYDPFKFNGETLSIQAIVNPLKSREKTRSHGTLEQMSEQQQFLSGVIATHNKFHQKYGYFEASIKIPDHDGTFPAFWLFHQTRSSQGRTQRSEIDIMENLGHAPHYIYNSFHYFKNVSENYSGDHTHVKPKPSGQIFTGTDYSENFHVYAVAWTPNKIKWYIDGVKVSEIENSEVNYEELYLKINLAMGGNWLNFPKSAGGMGRSSGERWPTSDDVRKFQNPKLEIDYVRAYELD